MMTCAKERIVIGQIISLSPSQMIARDNNLRERMSPINLLREGEGIILQVVMKDKRAADFQPLGV